MNKAASIPSFARPAFVERARVEFEALMQRAPELEFVDAILVDICGAIRGKRLPIADAHRLFENGMQLPKSVYLMDAKGEMVNPFGRGFGDGDPDGTAWPVPGIDQPRLGRRAQTGADAHHHAQRRRHADSRRAARGAGACTRPICRVAADARRRTGTGILSHRSRTRRQWRPAAAAQSAHGHPRTRQRRLQHR